MRKLKEHTGFIILILVVVAIASSAFLIKTNAASNDCIAKDECPDNRIFDTKPLLWESLPQQFTSINLVN